MSTPLRMLILTAFRAAHHDLNPREKHLRTIRFCMFIVIVGLVLSGATSFALQTELEWVLRLLQSDVIRGYAEFTHLLPWIQRVADAMTSTNRNYPFVAYGTDWLGFAHLVIAVAFIGPYRDPVRNRWVITFGLIACAGVLPLALIAGQIRGIPLAWRFIDCSFGFFSAILLLLSAHHLRALEPSKRKRPTRVLYHDISQRLSNDAHDWLH